MNDDGNEDRHYVRNDSWYRDDDYVDRDDEQ